jgi:hypothetical protein
MLQEQVATTELPSQLVVLGLLIVVVVLLLKISTQRN